MPRPAPAALVAALLLACPGSPTPPPPTKTSDVQQPSVLKDPPRVARDPNSPFRRPDKDKPLPRSEPQLPPAEVEAALAASAAARTSGDLYTATTALRQCANKIPKSTRCEGELALLLLDTPHHEVEARYYLEQATADDDPGADAEFFRRLSAALVRTGLLREASETMRRMIERLPEPSAADFAALANILQGMPKREVEAAEALHRAFELDPSQLDYLRDEALLLAQVPERRAEALERLLRYRDSIRTTEPDKAANVERQIADLQYDLAQAGAGAPEQPRGKTPAR